MIRSTKSARALGQLTLFAGLTLASDGTAQTRFTEVSQARGLGFQHTLGDLPQLSTPALHENEMFAGVACGDFDQNGWSDVFLAGGGGQPDQIFYNHEGQFTPDPIFASSNEAHVGGGVAVADYDNDGDLDIFIASLGPAQDQAIGHHRLYRNMGKGVFEDVAVDAGVNLTSLIHPDGSGACFGDYDLDGDLDLFVTGWRVRPTFGLGNVLFRNEGPENLGTFTDVTAAAGVQLARMAGFTPTFVDLDGDRYPELCVTADFETSRYFKNRGDGTFKIGTHAAGVGLDTNGMGSCFADLDRNGWLDWLVTSIDDPSQGSTGNMLYLNQGQHMFVEQSTSIGVKAGHWGWGVVAGDLDNDGWCDLVENNGWKKPKFSDENALLWMHQGNAYQDDAQLSGLLYSGQGRGAMTFDYDRDGDLDIILTSNDGPLGLFQNQLQQLPQEEHHFLRVRLDTHQRADLAPHGYGAQIELHAGGESWVQSIGCQNTFVSQSETVAHFGLGSIQSIDELIITWPDGLRQTLEGTSMDRTITISAPLVTK